MDTTVHLNSSAPRDRAMAHVRDLYLTVFQIKYGVMKVTLSPKYITITSGIGTMQIFCPAHTKQERKDRLDNLIGIVFDAFEEFLGTTVDSDAIYDACNDAMATIDE